MATRLRGSTLSLDDFETTELVELAYEADRDSAKLYLKKTHEKFIPTQSQIDEETVTTEDGPASATVHNAREAMGAVPGKPTHAETESQPTP